MAKLIFMNKGSPVQIQLSDRVLWVLAVLAVSGLGLALFLMGALGFYEFKRQTLQREFIHGQEVLNVCQTELKEFQETSMGELISPALLSTLKDQVGSDTTRQPEISPAESQTGN